METETKRRRRRCDRSYVVYELRVGKLSYIGITARTRPPQGHVLRRFGGFSTTQGNRNLRYKSDPFIR